MDSTTAAIPAEGYVPSPVEVAAFPGDAAAWAATVTPGAAIAGPLGLLDPATLPQDARVDALTGLERLSSWVTARQLRVLAALADDPLEHSVCAELDREWVKEDVRAALGESRDAAHARLLLAEDLVHRLPDTLAALERGLITVRHARALSEAVTPLDDDRARAVEAAALEFAGTRRDLASFRRKLRREVVKADPRSAAQQYEDRHAERRVSANVDSPGMSTFWALLPAHGCQALMAAIELRADLADPADPRSKDQRRADALVQIALDALTGTCPTCTGDGAGRVRAAGSGGVGSGRLHPVVQVTVALSTLLGLDHQPGELDGHGPIPAELARRLAGDQTGTWRRLVTDDLGHLIDYGRTVYRPPADLERHVVARDRTCRFPGCNRCACTCDLDHIIPWHMGGPTDEPNMTALCCRHHHAKHDRGWQLKRLPDGSIEWTSPTGHVYVVSPSTYPIDATTTAANLFPGDEHPATDADPDPPADEPPF